MHRNLREWDEFEAEVLVKRGRMEKRAAEDKARVALHRQALDVLNREMEGDAGYKDSIAVSADQSASMAVAGLCGVVPILREVLAALPEDSVHRKALEQARSDTEGVAALLQNCRVPCPNQESGDPEKFDMAGHDDDDYEDYGDFDGMDEECGDDLGDEWADQAGPSAGRAQQGTGSSRWRQSGGGSWGSGSWQRTEEQGSNGQQRDGNHGLTPTTAPTQTPLSAPPTATSPPPHTQSPPSNPHTAATNPLAATAHREQIELDGEQKLALAATYSSEDAARARELHARTTAMAEQQQSRVHEAAVRDTIQRARDKGIHFDQEWLSSLSMQDLEAWVFSHLG